MFLLPLIAHAIRTGMHCHASVIDRPLSFATAVLGSTFALGLSAQSLISASGKSVTLNTTTHENFCRLKTLIAMTGFLPQWDIVLCKIHLGDDCISRWITLTKELSQRNGHQRVGIGCLHWLRRVDVKTAYCFEWPWHVSQSNVTSNEHHTHSPDFGVHEWNRKRKLFFF